MSLLLAALYGEPLERRSNSITFSLETLYLLKLVPLLTGEQRGDRKGSDRLALLNSAD
jgi:hypothetical protein